MSSTAATPPTLSSPETPPEAQRILDFWFKDHDFKVWFSSSPAFDQEIKSTFFPLINSARTSTLDTWTSTPQGTLALLLLLDQFSRNVFRGSPDAFAADPKALEVATHAVVKGFDLQVPLMAQMFFYTPFVHSETLVAQVAARALNEGFARRLEQDEQLKMFAAKGVESCQEHMNCIAKFGRFPGRNQALGRESTEAEKEFLGKDKPAWS